MVIASPFEKLQTPDETLNRIQDRIRAAFEKVIDAIPSPAVVTFVAPVGLSAPGFLTLSPIRQPGLGITGPIIRRASVGSKLVAVVNLTDDTDVQTSFAQTVTQIDQIQQLTSTNLSAKKLLFVFLQGVA